jgi:hypothetical protein
MLLLLLLLLRLPNGGSAHALLTHPPSPRRQVLLEATRALQQPSAVKHRLLLLRGGSPSRAELKVLQKRLKDCLALLSSASQPCKPLSSSQVCAL